MPPLTNHCTHCENSHCQCRQPSKVFLATLSNRLSWRQASVITDSAQANKRLFAKLVKMFAHSPSDRKIKTSAQQRICTIPWNQFKFPAAGTNEAIQAKINSEAESEMEESASGEPGIVRFSRKESADKWRIKETCKLIFAIINCLSPGAKHRAAVSVH
ncbi:hypothetical protein PILCRDRAFT_93370 [Piloderma croceum F 1598]|uniref:Uncharacterized protein n=1 Tax=Piloderma croceum (strain F 1598) TaxID=765440 RepID=A0A0C3AFU7_PILCF|nr:hypothetical protein PILCRDRAFT_93370 [Piloderma croceum F 1598]